MDQAFSQRLKEIKGFPGFFKMGPTVSSSNAFQIPFECFLIPTNVQHQIKDYASSSIYVFAWPVALDALGTIPVGAIRRGQPSERQSGGWGRHSA